MHVPPPRFLYRSVFLNKFYHLQNREQQRPVNVRRRFVPVSLGRFIHVKSLKKSTKRMITSNRPLTDWFHRHRSTSVQMTDSM